MVKKICRILLNIILIAVSIVTILVAYNLVQTKIMKKDYCNFFGYTIFKVSTGSMSGTIEVGDIIIVKIEKDNINENDIISFKQDGYTITHRVIEINGGNLTTKGDANNASDNPILKTDIIGKVIKIIPNISIWEKVFTTPKVYISIAVTVFLFVLTFSLKDEKS